MKRILISCAIALSLLGASTAIATNSYAKSDEIYTSWRNNLAVGGYDILSFYQGNLIKGSPKISVNWKGVRWQFATKTNLETFIKEPEKYEPAYGGYCAWALANNKLAKGKPKHWTIKDGRLFLNINSQIKQLWLKHMDKFIEQGDKNWPTVFGAQ
ncbi:MAG: YHS domain-containing (seleno)protein [Robiginitomaculum sp.]